MTKLKFTIAAAISFYLAYITGTGEILNYVPFADTLNELAFFAITAGTGAIFSGCALFSKTNC